MSELLINTTDKSDQRNQENVIFIWFQSTINTNDEIDKTKQNLRLINNSTIFYNNINSCVDAIKSIENKKKTVLIISGNDASELLSPTVHDLRQLDSIFIFPGKQNEYNHLSDKFNAIVNIFDNPDELLKSVNQNLTDVENQMETFAYYDQHQQAIRDLSEESAKFLWFQLFNDVILHLPRDDKSKEEMISACRQYYQDNPCFIKQIDEFQQNYDKNKCIFWYTKDTFVYRLINKALRTEDIDQLYTFRYYIADLSSQLTYEYQKLKNGSKEAIPLYRGMIMTKKDAETLKANEGKLIAINSYWSTTRDRLCALEFIKGYVNNPDTIPVLFEIECDLQDENDSVIFADISSLSNFPGEKEVLFNVGAVFKIEKISEEKIENTDVLVVQKKRTGEGQEIARKFIEENRKEMEDESPTIMLCTLLKRMEKFEKSLQFLKRLLENPGSENIAHIHNRIGIALKDENKYDLALSHFREAFQLTYFSDLPQQKYAAFVLHNKGLIYAKRKQFNEALSFYRRAIRVLEKATDPNNCGIAQFYNSIGRVYLRQGLYDKALDYQQKALDMRIECLPYEHVVIAFSYADIGNIYSHKNDYEQALNYHRQALDLRKKHLPFNHHNIAWSLHQVGKIYYKMDDRRRARDYYLESLEIKRKCQSVSLYNTIPCILEDIAMTYDIKSEEALRYRIEALQIQREIEPIDYSVLTYRLDKLAFSYKSMNILKESLTYYEEALEIRTRYLSDNQLNLTSSFNNLASIYEKMGEKTRALNYYHKAMNIYRDNYPDDHDFCRKTRKNIARVNQSIRQQ